MQRYNNVFKQPKIFEENVTACNSVPVPLLFLYVFMQLLGIA